MPLLSLTQNDSDALFTIIKSDSSPSTSSIESYCFFFTLAPTIKMEILSKGNATSYGNLSSFPISISGMYSLWKDWSGKRDPKGGAQIYSVKGSIIFSP